MRIIFIFISLTATLLCKLVSARSSQIDKEDNKINLASKSSCSVKGGYDICDGGAGLLSVSFDSGEAVTCNELQTKKSTKKAPSVGYRKAGKDKYYTLVMVDPDAPSPDNPVMKHYLHWIVSDIRGADIMQGTVSGSQVIDYNGPTPPQGLHRYQFLLFTQTNGNLNANAPNSRSRFNPESFAHAHNLCLEATFQFRVNAGA